MSVVSKQLLPVILKQTRTILNQNYKRQVKLYSSSSIAKDKFILNSTLPEVDIPATSIPEFIHPKLEQYQNLVAVECGVTGRKYRYGEIKRMAENFGKNLRTKLKLQEGDVIAVLLPNVPEFPIAVLGSLEAGLIMTTLNPIYTSEEISRQLQDSGAKVLITLNELYTVGKTAEQLLQRSLPIITIKNENGQLLPEGAIDFSQLCNTPVDCPPFKPRRPEDIAFLPYSSGTTGLPKGVQLTHSNIVSNICQNIVPELEILEDATDSYQEICPAVLPMFHIYGLTSTCFNAFTKGCKSVTLPKFTPDLYIDTLKKQKPTILILVPPIVLFLTTHPEVKSEHLQTLRSIISGAAPLGALDEERFLEKAKKHINVLQGYGLTETSPTVTATPVPLKREKNIFGSIGVPVSNTQLKVVDIETDQSLGPNQLGELLVKGPQVMKGYHNKPEATSQTFTSDGWLRTGDMVYYNEDGALYVTDRLKELIKVKGFQVAPAELEEIIRDYPDVEDAAVIGIPHTNHGEVPRAYVVPKKRSKFNIRDLDDYVTKKVAEYKRIRGGIVITDTIPKTLSGKILRRDLKQEYLAQVGN